VNRRYFRGDAAFASPEIYEFLEAEDFGYAIRLPTNHVLHGKIENLLQRPRVDHHLRCAATMPASLSSRIMEQAPTGGGKGRVAPGRALPAGRSHRHQPGAAGRADRRLLQPPGYLRAWIKEDTGAIKWTRLLCRTFVANAVRLQSMPLAYNLGNLTRTLPMPKTAQPWSLTSPREKLIKIGAKVVSHGRFVTFQTAEVAVAAIDVRGLSLIARLRTPPAPA
jgi:hypothetical protein